MRLTKPLLIMLILLQMGMPLAAQTGEGEIENWVNAQVLCANTEAWLVQVNVSANVSAVYLFPDVVGAWVWFIGEARTRRFWVDKANEAVSIRVEVAEQGDYGADTLLLEAADGCEEEAHEQGEAVNECLGFSLIELIAMTGYEPLGDSFEVDGLRYLFHENLSFFVPTSAVWQWDLYVDGRLLLRFEQDENTACHITEVFEQ